MSPCWEEEPGATKPGSATLSEGTVPPVRAAFSPNPGPDAPEPVEALKSLLALPRMTTAEPFAGSCAGSALLCPGRSGGPLAASALRQQCPVS